MNAFSQSAPLKNRCGKLRENWLLKNCLLASWFPIALKSAHTESGKKVEACLDPALLRKFPECLPGFQPNKKPKLF